LIGTLVADHQNREGKNKRAVGRSNVHPFQREGRKEKKKKRKERKGKKTGEKEKAKKERNNDID
jgi:hypothetical protein